MHIWSDTSQILRRNKETTLNIYRSIKTKLFVHWESGMAWDRSNKKGPTTTMSIVWDKSNKHNTDSCVCHFDFCLIVMFTCLLSFLVLVWQFPEILQFWHINFEEHTAQKQIEWKFSMCRACQNWKLSKNKTTTAAETRKTYMCREQP